jgi:hypothetical protein
MSGERLTVRLIAGMAGVAVIYFHARAAENMKPGVSPTVAYTMSSGGLSEYYSDVGKSFLRRSRWSSMLVVLAIMLDRIL